MENCGDVEENQGEEHTVSIEEYREFHRRSLENPEDFWTEQAQAIDWHRPFDKVLDYENPPFSKWFVGGETNICHNAVDRHLEERGDQNALVYISTETDEQRTYTYRELYAEVAGGYLRDARVRPPRGDPLRRLRRVRGREPRNPHRRRETEGYGNDQRRQARR